EQPAILLGFHHAHPPGQGEGVEKIAVHRLRDTVLEVLLQCQCAECFGDRGFVDDLDRDTAGWPVECSESDFDRSREFFDLLLYAAKNAQRDTQRHQYPDSLAHPHYIEQRMCQYGPPV